MLALRWFSHNATTSGRVTSHVFASRGTTPDKALAVRRGRGVRPRAVVDDAGGRFGTTSRRRGIAAQRAPLPPRQSARGSEQIERVSVWLSTARVDRNGIRHMDMASDCHRCGCRRSIWASDDDRGIRVEHGAPCCSVVLACPAAEPTSHRLDPPPAVLYRAWASTKPWRM